MNYIDILILLLVAVFTYMGYLRGFIRDALDLLALVGSVFLAIATYGAIGSALARATTLPVNLASTIAFFMVWFVSMFLYYAVMTFSFDLIPENLINSPKNRWFGLLPGFLRGCLFVWFTINLLFILALSGSAKQTIEGSYFARTIVGNNQKVSEFLDKTFGSAARDAASFLTVTPQSDESVALGYKTQDVKSDPVAAKEMLKMVNEERASNGALPLVFDDKLAAVGLAHGKDMFARGYFSHNTPEGKTPFDRMDRAGISYLIAGENLALAPTLDEAFAGLMASPGHKANMLSTDFGRVGISVVDGGEYGKMFVQEFTN